MPRSVPLVCLWALATQVASLAVTSAQEAAPKPVDHRNLMVVRDSEGQERPIQTVADWELRRRQILAGMQLAMGPLPEDSRRVPLDIEVVSEDLTEKYLRRKIRYTSEPGDRVPAWLLIPHAVVGKVKGAPAMLCLHQTTGIGKDEPAGVGIRNNLNYGHELAERGFVCLIPDYPSFGEYPYDFKTQGKEYASGSMKAIWNNIRAVDLLLTVPEVHPQRIGVIGHSLGGHNSLFTAMFEPRLRAVVSSCGWTPFHDYYGGALAGWTSDRYMPRIRDVYHNSADEVPFDFNEIVAGLAPRGFFSNSPTRDENFDVAGVRKGVDAAKKIYELYGVPDKLRLETPDSAHDFPPEVRKASYQWLEQQLQPPAP